MNHLSPSDPGFLLIQESMTAGWKDRAGMQFIMLGSSSQKRKHQQQKHQLQPLTRAFQGRPQVPGRHRLAALR